MSSENNTSRTGRPTLATVKHLRLVTMLVVLSSGIGGCATHGAPTFVLFGAYFPAWLLVGLIGILAGIAARIVMVMTGLAEVIPAPLLICASIGTTIAIAAWLIGFAG